MKSAAEVEIFSPLEMAMLRRARAIVERFPTKVDGKWVRCHEVARVVGAELGLEVADGMYGGMEHSWLWTTPLDSELRAWRLPNVLDTYTPGREPQVQLIHTGPYSPIYYRKEMVHRSDIRVDVMQHLHSLLAPPELTPISGLSL